MAKKKITKRKPIRTAQPVVYEPTLPTQASAYISPLSRRTLPQLSWYEFIATGFFSGYLPKAPGTWGTVVAVIMFAITTHLIPGQGFIQLGFISLSWWAILLGISTTLLGIYTAEKLADEWQTDDPGEIVIDEFAGMFLACALIAPNLSSLAMAFILFRLFDILKPGPIMKLQKLHGGRGIVLDDVLAGVFAAPLASLGQIMLGYFFR